MKQYNGLIQLLFGMRTDSLMLFAFLSVSIPHAMASDVLPEESPSWYEGWFEWEQEEPQYAQVNEPFIELRSGPADVYPVIHSSEKGEWLQLLKRKTNWMKLRDEKGREGWANIEDVLLTIDGSGETVAISTPRFDDFSTRRWEGGLMMGQYNDEETAVNAAYLGYWLTENLSAELWASQALGETEETQFFALNVVHQIFPKWRYSPFFTLGFGHSFIKPKATLVQPEDDDDPLANVGVGMRIYLTDRYFLRAEVKEYKIFTTEESNEEATEWKIGLSVFF